MLDNITNNLEQLGMGAIALAKLLLNLLALLTGLATILGLFGSQWWIFEVLDHPRFQYCLILAIAMIIGGIDRQKWSFLLGILRGGYGGCCQGGAGSFWGQESS